MLRHLIARFLGDVSGEMLRTTAKTAAIAALFSVGVAFYLTERLQSDKKALERMAAGIDMTSTGSIFSPAKIDPCATPAKR